MQRPASRSDCVCVCVLCLWMCVRPCVPECVRVWLFMFSMFSFTTAASQMFLDIRGCNCSWYEVCDCVFITDWALVSTVFLWPTVGIMFYPSTILRGVASVSHCCLVCTETTWTCHWSVLLAGSCYNFDWLGCTRKWFWFHCLFLQIQIIPITWHSLDNNLHVMLRAFFLSVFLCCLFQSAPGPVHKTGDVVLYSVTELLQPQILILYSWQYLCAVLTPLFPWRQCWVIRRFLSVLSVFTH